MTAPKSKVPKPERMVRAPKTVNSVIRRAQWRDGEAESTVMEDREVSEDDPDDILELLSDVGTPKRPHSTVVPGAWKPGEAEDEGVRQVDMVDDPEDTVAIDQQLGGAPEVDVSDHFGRCWDRGTSGASPMAG